MNDHDVAEQIKTREVVLAFDRIRTNALPLDVLTDNRFDFGAERPGLTLADAVHAKVRTEYHRLQPPHVQFGRGLHRSFEPHQGNRKPHATL